MALVSEAKIEGINFQMGPSLQVGDEIWVSCADTIQSGYNTAQPPQKLGVVTNIGENHIEFNFSSIGSNVNNYKTYPGNCNNIFLSFKKDCSVNIASLKGYYASVTFTNDDHQDKNELFAVNARIALSSK